MVGLGGSFWFRVMALAIPVEKQIGDDIGLAFRDHWKTLVKMGPRKTNKGKIF